MNILVIQNDGLDPIGILGEHLINLGATLSTWLPEQQPNPPRGDYDSLIVLGGMMNAHEDEKFPHLQQTVDLIHQFHCSHKPVMGICLGAQLIARTFGGSVYPHHTPEIGFSPLQVADPTATEPWLTHCPEDLHLMQWHFDTFDLPPQATLLMTNGLCKHQAYRIGTHVYGFQFHFEITPAMLSDWLAIEQDWIAAHNPALNQQLPHQLQTYGQQSFQFAQAVAQFWITLISTPLTPTQTT